MATYCVTLREDDDWGVVEDRFKTKPPALDRLHELEAAGTFARLVRWDHPGQPTEMLRVIGRARQQSAPATVATHETAPTSARVDGESTYVADSIVTALCEMDVEATHRYPDAQVPAVVWTAGLRQYHEHLNATRGSRLGCEPAWSRRLAELLVAQGVEARSEVRYPREALPPNKRWQNCDLVVGHGGSLWIEIKGAWPVCFRARANGSIDEYLWGTYRKHIRRSTYEDFEKLERLTAPAAARLGVLLVGFDSPLERLDHEVADLSRRIDPSWTGGKIASWREPNWNTQARVWLWTRAVSTAAGRNGGDSP